MGTTPFWRRLRALWTLVALVSLGSGCDDATAPPAASPISAAEVDPATGRFVLERGEIVGPDGSVIAVDLLGSNLRVDSRTGRVSLDVALRHAGSVPLYAPARVWVGCFLPAEGSVANADLVSRRPGCRPWGFDYSSLMGDDFKLAPGETSQAKTWVFERPHLVSFGFSCELDFALQPSIAPVLLTDRQPEEIPQDHYLLGGFHLEGSILSLDVGFSGCSPDHPFTLYAGRRFMESWPVQTWLLLSHDDRDEACDAAFQRTVSFDLDPIRQEYRRVYGSAGTVRLRFRDFQGALHVIDLEP